MIADASGATQDYSRRPVTSPGPQSPSRSAVPSVRALRALLALVAAVGVVLLVVSTWATVVEIRVLTTSALVAQDTSISGGDLHGIAMLPVALFAALMLAGAVRGARPAMLALAATGLLALGLIVFLDVPELDNSGQVAQFYEDVSAGAASGFYLETLGAVLLLLAGGAMFVLHAEAVSQRVQALGTGLATSAGALGGSVRAGAGRARTGASRAREAAERRGAEHAARRSAAGAGADEDDDPAV